MNEALKAAIEEFRNICFEDIPKRCNVSLAGDGIKIKYLNKVYLVSPDGAVSFLSPLTFSPSIPLPPLVKGGKKGLLEEGKGLAEGGREVSDREKTIILHYLTLSKGTPLTGKLIDFREIPGGTMYYSVFERRVYEPFLEFFGERPPLFVEAAASLGGKKVNLGDIAFRFVVLPQIPINFILHKGDEEFSPACKVLFDPNVSDHLPIEDIVVVCEYIVEELKE